MIREGRQMLAEDLKELHQRSKGRLPKETIALMERMKEELIATKIMESVPKVGDSMPEFNLINAMGQMISSSNLLAKGPLVISFYRGAWCSYCNLELRAYQSILNEIHERGGQLVAISPELPDTSITLTEKHNLQFEVLSDKDNEFAKVLGIAFSMQEELVTLYKSFGFDIENAQGNANYELPIPATLVVDQRGKILFIHAEVDYTKRAEPRSVLAYL